jgi:hypothetical protein
MSNVRRPMKMNSVRFVVVVAIAIAVTGCSTVDRDEGRFVTNGRTLTQISKPLLSKVRDVWSSESEANAKESKLDPRDIRWALDYIATTETAGIAPCSSLTLALVRQLPLRPFAVENVRSERVQFNPRTFYESWAIKSCDEWHEWRVLDEATDPRNPLRVLLWTRRLTPPSSGQPSAAAHVER